MSLALSKNSFSSFEQLSPSLSSPVSAKANSNYWDDSLLPNRGYFDAATKISNLAWILLDDDEEFFSTSAKFAEGYIQAIELAIGTNTVRKIYSRNPSLVEITRTKEKLLARLSQNQWLPDISHATENGGDIRIMEFYKHSSHLVCIFDSDGIQLLWKNNDKTYSEVIANQTLDPEAFEQKVLKILAT